LDSAAFCAACGKPLGQATSTDSPAAPASVPAAAAPVAPASGALADNVAGMLAYITIIPAIIFLVMEPFNKKPFVRFHSFQCLFLAVASFALRIVLMILGMIPFIRLLMLLIAPIVWLLILVLVIVCLIKAYQGQMWKLPFIGDLAEKNANRV